VHRDGKTSATAYTRAITARRLTSSCTEAAKARCTRPGASRNCWSACKNDSGEWPTVPVMIGGTRATATS